MRCCCCCCRCCCLSSDSWWNTSTQRIILNLKMCSHCANYKAWVAFRSTRGILCVQNVFIICCYLVVIIYTLTFCGLVMIFCSNTRAGNTCQGGSVFLVTYTFPCLFGPSVGEIAHDQNGAQGDAGALRRQILRVQNWTHGLGETALSR